MKGILPAAAVPYGDDGSINYDEFGRIVDWFVSTGVHGIVVNGGNGDFMLTSGTEKRALLRVAVDAAASRVPVYAGTGAQTTLETITLSRDAQNAGAAGLLVIAPNSIHPSSDELLGHYRSVAAATALPLYVYNNPGMASGNSLTPDEVLQLSATVGVAGVKDSSGNLGHIGHMIAARPRGFRVIIGTDTLILPGLVCGAEGAVSGGACVIPEAMVAMYDAYQASDLQEARRLHSECVFGLQPIHELATRPQAVREGLEILGFAMGPPRLPLLPMGPAARRKAEEVIARAREKLLH